MNYKVKNKVFASLEEAAAYANDYFKSTGIITAITETKQKITHVYREER